MKSLADALVGKAPVGDTSATTATPPPPYVPNTYSLWKPPVPSRYANASLDDVPANIRGKFDTIRTTRKGFYIHGGVGTGKTHIAYALYRSDIARGARFWNVTELLREIRADFERPHNEKQRVEESLMSHRGILFLDDIGAEKVTDWVLETFYLIINHYYNERLPIVFTSNCRIKELDSRIGDRIASRIVESCDIIELTGADRRLAK